MVASGTIPNGAAVVVNTDGTVGIVTLIPGTAPSLTGLGPRTDYNADKDYGASVYLEAHDTFLLLYNDADNSDYFSIATATISGSTVTVGSPTQITNQYAAYFSIAVHPTQGYGLITYKPDDTGNLRYRAFSYNGSSFTFGSASQTNDASIIQSKVVYMTGTQRFFVQFKSGNNGKCFSVGVNSSNLNTDNTSEIRYDNSNGCANPSVAYDPDTDTCVLVWSNDSSNGEAIRVKVSSSAVTKGSIVTTQSGGVSAGRAITYDTNANKFVAFYKSTTSNNWIAQVVAVSGYQSTALSWPASGETTVSTINVANQFKHAVEFDSHRNKIVFVFKSNSLSYYSVGTVSGSSISFSSTLQFISTDYNQNADLSFDPNQNKLLLSYGAFDSNKRHANSLDTIPDTSNLTADNFIGFSDAAYSDGQTANIQIEGSVDDAQSSLTTAKVHYINPTDGSLSTTAGTPSVEAGTAISSTQIIVKG